MNLVLDGKALASVLPVSGTLTSAWRAEGDRGFLRHGYSKDPVYAPLYGLKEFRKTWGLTRGDPYDATRETGEYVLQLR